VRRRRSGTRTGRWARAGRLHAENGSNWFITGGADTRWNDSDLDQLEQVPGSAFEMVDTSPVHTG
jgi:hypothetical protein